MKPSPLQATLRIIHAGHEMMSARDIARLQEFVIQPASPWISQNETMAFCRALAGEFVETSDDYFFLLAENDRLLAHAWYQVSRRNPAIAVLGYVYTDMKARGGGLATRLMKVVWGHFISHGGEAMYLGTSNPIACQLYLKSCFQTYHDHVLRRTSQNIDELEFDEA